MAQYGAHRTVQVADDDRVVASAHVTTSIERDTAQAALHAGAGHVPVASGAGLVEAILDLPEVQDRADMSATVPFGYAESLQQLRAHTTDLHTGRAGSTAIIDADLPEPPDAPHTKDTNPEA